MTQFFLSYLLTSVIGTVSALIFLLIKPVTKKYFSASWHYYAWLVVLIVMIMPLRFNVQVALPAKIKPMEEVQVVRDTYREKELNETPERAEINKGEHGEEKPLYVNIAEEKTAEANLQREINGVSFFKEHINLFANIWLWGMILFFAYKVIKYKVFLKNIFKNSEKAEIDDLQENVEVRVINGVSSPFVVGLYKPVLVLPHEEFSENHMKNIIAHELTHIKRHDIMYKWVVAIVKAVHWFNPFMYLIVGEIAKDCEISCDEVVTKYMSNEEKKNYADTILSFAFGYGKAIPFTTSIAGGKKSLKERFISIKNSKRMSKKNAAVSVIVALAFFADGIGISGIAGGTLLPPGENKGELKKGDYITLGKYQGESIVWRYASDDETGKLFLSHKFICKKPFGEYGNREESDLREWLNSDEQFMNSNKESGYLYDSNFTEAQKSVIKEVSVYCDEELFTGKVLPYEVKKGFLSKEESCFVRPAFYLNEENAVILSGNGTKRNPFVIDGKSAPNKFMENSLYGYKDNEGNVIVPPKYLKAGDFYENAALVILPENPYELRVIAPDGTYLFDKAFCAVNNFDSGYALIRANEKKEYSYINKKGELATELLFEDAGNFENGLARVKFQGKIGVIDTKFNFYPDDITKE